VRTLLVVPDLFAGEGGIARIMRLYLKAAVELSASAEDVRYISLLDADNPPQRLQALLGANAVTPVNCRRSRLKLLFAVCWHGMWADRIVCGHVHHLILVRLAQLLRPSLKYYLVAHGIEVWRPFTFLERFALRGANKIFCVSEYSRRQMLRFYPALEPRRVVHVPNTFDPAFTPPSPASQATKPDTPRLLVVSRLDSGDPYKGVDLVIEAMPAILQRYPRAQLRIVGGGDDRARLERFAGALGLGAAVHFTGVISDAELKQEYERCDLFALPSRKEGFGLVYLEAMTYGKPCIAARAGGAPEVVNAKVGFLVEYGNVDQIALAAADIIDHPRDPAAVREQAAAFSFSVFREKLAAALIV
jgi:phosphatidylinositol alpha-1,6-mannosyltransferase